MNAAVLETVQHLALPDVVAQSFEGLTSLPHFNPDDGAHPLNRNVAELRQPLATPMAFYSAHRNMPEGFRDRSRTCLDWTVGGTEMYMKAVSWINAASCASPAGGEDAHAAGERSQAISALPITRQEIDPHGPIRDPEIRLQIAASISALVDSKSQKRPCRPTRCHGDGCYRQTAGASKLFHLPRILFSQSLMWRVPNV
jgi:hypothetical protein